VIRIFNYIVDIREAVVFGLCILFSFILMLTDNNDPVWPIRRLTINTIGRLGAYVYKIGAYFDLREENEELREKNTQLAFLNIQLQDALLENFRLKKLLEFKERTTFKLIPAEIIGQNPNEILNGYILNEGSKSGIEISDAVLAADGLVGKIVKVDPNFSITQILIDQNSRISARIQRNRELGIISWDGGVNLKLLYIAKTIEIFKGDVIITSGYSGIFPENIKIGVVIHVSTKTGNMFHDIIVQPTVNFSGLEEVFILKK
jgi:rod shape-determining protein MreC